MITHIRLLALGLALSLSLVFVPARAVARAAADTLPPRLTDAEFWKLSEDLS